MLRSEDSIRWIRRVVYLADGTTRSSSTFWEFRCGCGNEFQVRNDNLPKHRGQCRVCHNKSRAGTPNLKNRKKPYESLYNKLLTSCRDRTITCSLSFEDFVEFTKKKECHYCGQPVNWSEFYVTKNGSACNLDRKHNLGYVKEDIVVACKRCNMVKGKWFTYEEFRRLSEIIKLIDLERIYG